MTDFAAARKNMVDSQIHTMGVVNESILEAFRTVPREKFVALVQQGIAYNDEDLPVAPNRSLMEPVTHSRLLQAAAPSLADIALDVGCATGYSAALLGLLCGRVVGCEPDAALLAQAEQNWKSLGYANIQPHQAPFDHGCPEHGPYSLIVVNGSVAEIPASLTNLLAPGGRLLAVVRKPEDRIGRAVLVLKNAQGVLSDRVLFDAAVPYLPGLEPRKEFVF